MDISELTNITEKLMKKLKAKGIDDIVLHSGIGSEYQTKFTNSRIVKTEVSSAASISVFCNWNGKIIETTLKDANEKGIGRLVGNLEKYVRYIPKNEKFEGIAEGPFKYGKLNYDKKLENPERIIADSIETAIAAAERNGGERNSGVMETKTSKTYLLTSGNCEVEDRDSEIYFSFRSICDKESSGHKVYAARSLKGFNPKKLAKEAAQFASDSKGDKAEVMGQFDVVFEPLPLAIMLEHIGDSTSAFEVESGNSFLKDKLNKKVGSKVFNLTDDPLLNDGYGSTTFDSEGVKTRKTELIKNGVLKTYVHNTSTAKRAKTKTTGNAGLISPHPWNIVLEKGKLSREKLISNVDNGIYVTNAWYMRFHNYLTGEFSIIPRDAIFLIKNGRIDKPVKNVRLNASLQELMEKTEKIGNNTEKIHSWEVGGSVITPSILARDIKITKPTS